jgi:hypothetical protein
LVRVIGPGSWDGGKQVGNFYTVKNKTLAVRLMKLRKGVKSKKWKGTETFFSTKKQKKKASTFVVRVTQLIEVY